VKHGTPELGTSDQRKLGPGNLRKIEESAGTLLVKSWGCWNKMQYFGNSDEMLPFILTASPRPSLSPRWRKMLPPQSTLKSIFEEYWIPKLNKL
jgi:hypothetical protein